MYGMIQLGQTLVTMTTRIALNDMEEIVLYE